MNSVSLRRFVATDSVEALTALLHEAYAAHAAAGRKFFASYQRVEDPGRVLDRRSEGEMIGTVTLVAPYHFPVGYPAPPLAGTFYQMAVIPSRLRTGIGTRLLELGERRILDLGCEEVSIDTSEQATELIDWYKRRGYVPKGEWRWSVTNYPSVVLHKRFARAAN